MARHTPVLGLIDRNGFPSRPDCVDGFVIEVDWIDLQPNAGGSTAADIKTNNPIDTALAQIVAYTNGNAGIQTRGRALKLKVGLQRAVGGRKGSSRDPVWLRNACGTLQMESPNDQPGVFHTVTKWWEAVYLNAYDDLIAALQDKYDNSTGNNTKLGDLVVGGATSIYAEPFLRQYSSAQNRTNLLNAGYTRAKDQAALESVIDAHAIFVEIPQSVAYSPHQWVTSSGGAGTPDMAFTLEMMARHRSNLGPLAIIENNSYNYISENEPPGNGQINKPPQALYGQPTGSAPLFAYSSGIFSYRGPNSLICEQTEQAGHLDDTNTDMDELLVGAKNQGCTSIELPGSFPYAIPGDAGAGAGTTGNTRVAFLEAHNAAIAANWVSYGGSNAPTTPGQPAVVGSPTTTSLTVSWAASTDADGDADHYRVQWSLDAGATWQTIGGDVAFGTNQVTHTFGPSTSVRTAKTRVRAIDAANNQSAFSTPSANITIPAEPPPDTVPPTVVANVVAVQNADGADVAWDAATDATSGVDYYEVWQKQTAPTVGPYIQVQTATGLNVTVGSLTNGATYKWAVHAVDAVGNRQATAGESNALQIVVAVPPSWPDRPQLVYLPGAGTVTLLWPDADGAIEYRFSRTGGDGFTPLTIDDTNATRYAYTDNTVVDGTVYQFAVVAVAASGAESVVLYTEFTAGVQELLLVKRIQI